jgi:outer membrane protein TolC
MKPGRAIHRVNYHSIHRPISAIVLIAALAALFFITDIFAIDADVKKLIRRATGITDGDVAEAAGKNEVTLFGAYALAVHNTERLAIQGEGSIQAAEKKIQAVETFLPYLSLRANYAMPLPRYNYIAIARSAASLYLRQPIVTGLKEASQIKSSIAMEKIRELELHHNAGLLLSDIAAAFYSVLLLDRDLKNNEQLLDLYGRTINELRRRVNIGRSRQSDILRTSSQLYRLQADTRSRSAQLEHAKLVLATLTGSETGLSPADTEAIGDPGYTAGDLTKIAGARWDVKAAREQVVYAKAGVLAAYGVHLPSLYLESSYFFYYGESTATPQWKLAQQYSSGKGILSGPPSKTRDYYVSLGAELPIFGGDITFAKVREANSARRQAELVLSQTERLARTEIIDSFRLWESAKLELDAYRLALASAEDNYRVVAGEYNLNRVTILDMLTALTALQSAREDHERARLQLKLNRIRLGIAANEFSGDNVRMLK